MSLVLKRRVSPQKCSTSTDPILAFSFEENGTMGHTVPLFFDQTTVCIATNKTESICDPSTFTEPALVLVQAEMLESGAVVKTTF